MVDWPAQPSLPPGLPYGYITPAGFGDLSAFASPMTSQQIDALRIKFQESLTQIIVLAVQGFLNAGEAAFDQLSSWALQISNAANGAADDLADLLDSLLGTGHTISDLVDYFQDTAANATAALTDLATFLSATGQASIAALGAALNTLIGYLTSIPASLLSGALPTGLTVSGTSLSTLFTNINSSGQLLLSGATGALNTAVTIGGQAVSSLFNGSGQFIGVLNSAATGALNTAVTVGGVSLNTLFTNINSAGQLLGAGITGAINTAATVAGQAIGTIQANAQGLVEGINNAAAGLLSGGSALLADATTNLGLLFGSAPQYLQGVSGAFGQSATNAAFAAAAGAQAAASSQLAQQQAAFAAVFNVSPATAGNTNITVDFTSMANAANMAGVMSPGNTNIGITSGAAARQVGTASSSDVEVFPTQTTTDYQVITATLGSLNNVPSAYTEVAGRVNSTRTTRVVAAVTDVNVITLGCWVSGSWTFFAQNTLLSIASGGVVKLVLGDPASSSPYAMQVLYNGTPVITYTDTSHVSQVGASYQYVGLAMGNGSINSGKYPPAIRSVTYQDNPPTPASYPFSGTPTAGTKGRMYVSNDVGLIQRDNGTAWEYIWGGPLGYFTPPPSTGWSWVNQGTASTATELGGERITAPTGSRNWRLRTRSLSPTSNYTATAYLEVAALSFATGSAQWYGAIGLRNSSSGSFITFGPGYYTTNHVRLIVYRWTNATTFSASTYDVPIYDVTGAVVPNWIRIRDDGTNRYFEYSLNGVDWILVASEGRTAFITPDQFILGASNEGTGQDMKVRLRSLSGIA